MIWRWAAWKIWTRCETCFGLKSWHSEWRHLFCATILLSLTSMGKGQDGSPSSHSWTSWVTTCRELERTSPLKSHAMWSQIFFEYLPISPALCSRVPFIIFIYFHTHSDIYFTYSMEIVSQHSWRSWFRIRHASLPYSPFPSFSPIDCAISTPTSCQLFQAPR